MNYFTKGIFTLLTVCCAFMFISCHNMCADLEAVIGPVCWIDKLEWVDASHRTSITSGASAKFSSTLENGRYVISSTDSGNWSFSNLGRDIKGFEADVKINSGSYAGIQLWAHDSYAKYEIRIDSNKYLYVFYNEGKSDSKNNYILKKTNAVSDPNAYNKIKLKINKDRSSTVYINGDKVCDIPDHSLHYGFIAVLSGGNCNFKINNIQH